MNVQGDMNTPKPIKKDERLDPVRRDPFRPIAPIPDEPKQNNKFQEFLDKKGSKEKKEKATNTTTSEENPSIFALAAQRKNEQQTQDDTPDLLASAEEEPSLIDTEDPAEMQAKKSQTETPTKKSQVKIANSSVSNDEEKPAAKQPLGKKRDQELQDMSFAAYVPPKETPQTTPVTSEKVSYTSSTTTKETLIKMIEQLDASMQVVKDGHKTEVTIRLQYPPMFKGAEVTVTEHTGSKGQLDITFKNIQDVQAQRFIQFKQNQEELQARLLERGYMINKIQIDYSDENISSARSDDTSGQSRSGGSMSEGKKSRENDDGTVT